MEVTEPVSHDRVSPLEVSTGDSISIQILPQRICFRIDSPPGDYILKQSLWGRENVSSSIEIYSPPGECLFRRELGFNHITSVAYQSTLGLFWLTHLCLNYDLFLVIDRKFYAISP